MYLQLRKCEKLSQTYRKIADLRLRNTSCSFAEFAVAKLSVNLRCPALIDSVLSCHSLLNDHLKKNVGKKLYVCLLCSKEKQLSKILLLFIVGPNNLSVVMV